MSNAASTVRYDARELCKFATALFQAAGLEQDKAAIVAEVLVLADEMGHTTHGLALANNYVDALRKGTMTREGSYEVISDRGACVTWDGRRLPGIWLTYSALDLAMERVAQYGTVTIVIARSHHIGCLAAYMPRVTERGYMAIISTTNPGNATVAPYGGTRALFTPDPISAGIPTSGDPIILDVSASITTNNLSWRLQKEGRKFPHKWLMDANGELTDDPQAINEGGTILPAGGLDHGQKGYSWALLSETLTQGLSGLNRAIAPKGQGACVFIQVIDPSAFAGIDAFTQQTDWLVDACRNNPPRPGVDRVRVPGEQALQKKRKALEQGVELHAGIMEGLLPVAEELNVPVPTVKGA